MVKNASNWSLFWRLLGKGAEEEFTYQGWQGVDRFPVKVLGRKCQEDHVLLYRAIWFNLHFEHRNGISTWELVRVSTNATATRGDPPQKNLEYFLSYHIGNYSNSCSQSVPPFQTLPNVFMYIWKETDCSRKLKEDSHSHFQNIKSEKWELKIRLDIAAVWETISKRHTWEEATLDSTNRTLFWMK